MAGKEVRTFAHEMLHDCGVDACLVAADRNRVAFSVRVTREYGCPEEVICDRSQILPLNKEKDKGHGL